MEGFDRQMLPCEFLSFLPVVVSEIADPSSLLAEQDDKVGLDFGRDEVHDYFVKAQMP